jgi:hypothetical protein
LFLHAILGQRGRVGMDAHRNALEAGHRGASLLSLHGSVEVDRCS